MSCNKYLPHVVVVPEDKADSDIAVAFQMNVDFYENMDIVDYQRGWLRVVEWMERNISTLRRFQSRFLVLLMDFDEDESRRSLVEDRIPSEFKDRVFVVGPRDEPEKIPYKLEEIGRKLAEDCRYGTSSMWDNPHLSHNAGELRRMRETLRVHLFDANA